MMEVSLSLAAIGGMLIISQLSPGPDVFFVFRTALAQGFRGGFTVGLGISLGFFIQAVIVCSLGQHIMNQSWSYYLLIAAACWLLYLAWKIFPRQRKGTDESQLEGQQERESTISLLRQGFLCNILNPKCTLFICSLTILPLCEYTPRFPAYPVALVLTLLIAGQLGWTLWSALLQWGPVRKFYLRHTFVMDGLFSVMLAVFAVILLIP